MDEKKEAYRVPADNLDKLQERIAKLNRRAGKLGCAPVVLHVGDPERETYKVQARDEDGYLIRDPKTGEVVLEEKVRIFHPIRVEGEAPKYAGWTFVAAMEYLAANGENEAAMFLRVAPGQAIPDSWRHADQKCDHCGTVRRRSETFVVRHEDGTHKQVGRQCIADFLGHTDPKRFAEIAEFLVSAGDICGEAEEEGWGGGSGPGVLWLRDYLAYVAMCVRSDGWLSRSKARELAQQGQGGYATADRALAAMHAKPTKEEPRPPRPEEQDAAIVEKALTWVREDLRVRENLDDYQHNLVVICTREAIPMKGMGVAASVIQAYKREMGLLAERKARLERESKSEFFGEVGKREVFGLTLLKTVDCNSQFGLTVLHKFVDGKGNIATWFASGTGYLEIGKTYQIKGTVKNHEEFRGIKQTMLTRCAVEGEWYCPGCRRSNVPDASDPVDTCPCGVRRGSWVCPNDHKVVGPDVKTCECGHDQKSWSCNKCRQYNVRKAKTCQRTVEGPDAGICGAPKNAWVCRGYGCGKAVEPKVDVCPACKTDRNGMFRGGESIQSEVKA